MKLKDVGLLQRHVEKIILGVALLALLVICLMYVVGNPYAAEINNRPVNPGGVAEVVQSTAQQLTNALNANASPIPDRPIPRYTEDFISRLDRPVSSLAQLAVPMGAPGLGATIDMGPQNIEPYDVPRPPVPVELTARATHGVLGVIEPRQAREQLTQLIGNRQPADFRSVSVAGTFDMDQWIERLRSDRRGQRMPEGFWRSLLGISAVYLQRQELDPVTGQWGEAVLIDPLPTQMAFLPTAKAEYSNEQADEYVMFVKDHQEQIARPEFPPLAGTAQWVPPDSEVQELSPEDHSKLSKLRAEIARLQSQIDRMTQTLERREGAERAQSDRQGRTPVRPQTPILDFSGEMDRFGGRGPAPGQVVQPRTPTTAGDDMREQLETLRKRLQEATAERDKLLGVEPDIVSQQQPFGVGGFDPMDRFAAMRDDPRFAIQMGPDPYGPALRRNPAVPAPGATGSTADEPSRKIKIWAHDLTVQPGRTYRYRVIAAVLNPLFRQNRVAPEQKEEHFNKISLEPDAEELAASPWSQPIPVDPEYYFFLVQGAAQQQVATVEVWRVFAGGWREHRFTVHPGDAIGETVEMTTELGPQQVDMRVGVVVVDLASTAAGPGAGAGTRMLYLDPSRNQILSRTVQEDSNSPDRVRLQNSAARDAELLAARGTGGSRSEAALPR
jgi:hypothetical protein